VITDNRYTCIVYLIIQTKNITQHTHKIKCVYWNGPKLNELKHIDITQQTVFALANNVLFRVRKLANQGK